jgi:hypothetical protein
MQPLTKEWYEKMGERDADYLGDGIYVSRDAGHQIWLRTNRDGMIHEIALEYHTLGVLLAYAERSRPNAG